MDGSLKSPSVLDAVDAALGHTRRICFGPFDFSKWLALGFCAFLAQLGQGGGGYTGGNPFGMNGKEDLTGKWIPWVVAHLLFVAGLAAVLLAFGLALWALFLWLGSRGEFMFLEGVLKDRGAVSEPWRRFREQGNSLFRLRLLVGLAGVAAVLAIVGVALALAWPAIRSGAFTAGALAGALVGVCGLVPLMFALILLQLVLRDFVPPVMLARNIGASIALRVFWSEVLSGRMVSFLLFYLLYLAIAVASGIVMAIAMCLTCCIAALPYISSVVFLPVLVFFRCYSLCFLGQIGPQWTLLPAPGASAPPAPAEPVRSSEPPAP